MAVEEAGAWLTRLGCNEDSMKKKKKPASYLRLSACSVLSILCTCCQWVSLKEEVLVPHPSYSTEDSL